MDDLTTGLIVLAAFLLAWLLYSLSAHSDDKRELEAYREAIKNLGCFEPKLIKAFGAVRHSFYNYSAAIDIDTVNRMGKIGRERLRAKDNSEEFEEVMDILRGDPPMADKEPDDE